MNKMIPTLATATLALTAFAAQADTTPELVGFSVPTSQAIRTIVVTPATRWVNVKDGEVVKFVVNGQEFAFDFAGGDDAMIDLQRLAPAGMLDHAVPVYVARDPELDAN